MGWYHVAEFTESFYGYHFALYSEYIATVEHKLVMLYKIMHTLFSVLKLGNGFYVSRHESNFRVEIKIKKEILLNEKDIDS